LTNHIFPDHAVSLGKQPSPMGGWMPALADKLIETGEIELGIATNISGHNFSESNINNKTYFTVPLPSGTINYRYLPLSLVQSYRSIIDSFDPDIIHTHGTEYFHGLLTGRKLIQKPAVISIQGLIDVYKDYYFGGMPMVQVARSRTLRDWVRFDGMVEQEMRWRRRAKWEREIFASNRFFIGRTQWDRAHTQRLNPYAYYYHCDEMLRPPFYENSWELGNVNRLTIYVPSASYPLKGFHIVLKAVSLLRRKFPDIKVRVSSSGFYHTASLNQYIWNSIRTNGYNKYLTDLIRNEALDRNVFSTGMLEAAGVVGELKNAHVFVLPSYIENSPNSLAEAMLVGTPSVVSYTGGVPSIVNDGESALCFPPGDFTILAEQIQRIFSNDSLALKLSEHAKTRARERHLRDKIVVQQLQIYNAVIKEARQGVVS